MKKKVALTAAAVAMVGTLAVGGTLAWFTDTETATNVVTTGNVNISIEESTDGANYTKKENGEGITFDDQYVPGDTVDKYVRIANVGANNAYVRVQVVFEGLASDIEEPKLNLGDDWTLNEDGWYYYNKELSTNTYTDDLFATVDIPGTWDNAMVDTEFNIVLNAEAIQSDNTGDNAVDAFADKEITDLEVDMLN